jgi:hypothetical protein
MKIHNHKLIHFEDYSQYQTHSESALDDIQLSTHGSDQSFLDQQSLLHCFWRILYRRQMIRAKEESQETKQEDQDSVGVGRIIQIIRLLGILHKKIILETRTSSTLNSNS